MEIKSEVFCVVQMTRLEAARTLVLPEQLKDKLREWLEQNRPDEAAIIEGASVHPALPAVGVKPKLALPTTHKAMRRLRQETKRVACPQCGKKCIERGLNVHIARAHGKEKETA